MATSWTYLPPGTTSWTVPDSWNPDDNSVQCWGAGAGGSGTYYRSGGGGGSYAADYNLNLTPGAVIPVLVGSGGAGGTSSNYGEDGGDTLFGDSPNLLYAGGGKGQIRSGGVATVGSVLFDGGAGGYAQTDYYGGGGGGGAAGPLGAGGDAGLGSATWGVYFAGGGAGGDGGETGGTATDTASGAGGANGNGFGGGAAATSGDGNAGYAGGGGSGGADANSTGGQGGDGISLYSSYGSGGGGGGGGGSNSGFGGPGGAGGGFGGGGGGAGGSSGGGSYGGDGGDGGIIISWTPSVQATVGGTGSLTCDADVSRWQFATATLAGAGVFTGVAQVAYPGPLMDEPPASSVPLFFTADIECYDGSGTSYIRASDAGYRTSPSDPSGPIAYGPYIAEAFQVDNQMNLDPARSSIGASWGSLKLNNLSRRYDTIAADWNSDGRSLVIKYGERIWDPRRQLWVDPNVSLLSTVFSGVATPWTLSEQTLSIPLRDAGYWLERPYQPDTFGGTGGLDGTSDMKGMPIPRCRGGTTTDPIRNVPMLLIDPTYLIYKYNDGPGTVVALWEGGAATITRDSDTTDLYTGVTPAGTYRTDNAHGLIQLGSKPAAELTADVTGEFSSGTYSHNVMHVVGHMLLDDLELPEASFDWNSVNDLDLSLPYTAGVYFGAQNTPQGDEAIRLVMQGLGVQLVPLADGRLRLVDLTALAGSPEIVASYDDSNIVAIQVASLPDTISPIPWRLRIGYQHNYTVQTSGLLGSATASRTQFVSAADRWAEWSDTGTKSAYRRPNDPDPIPTILLSSAAAQARADALGALWGVRRRLYDVTLPLRLAIVRNIGDFIEIDFPIENLDSGAIGMVVGYKVRSLDATMTLRVLV